MGRARPHSRVEASLALRTNRDRELVVRTSARADATGRYRLRLPYANRGAPPSVRPARAWELVCEGERAELVIAEAQVRSGASVAGPSLCPAPVAFPPDGGEGGGLR